MLLLVSYRPECQHARGGKTSYSQLRLDALAAEAARELLDVLLGEHLGLAPLKQLLVRRGNPFFPEETVRPLVETKALAGERGRYRLTQSIQAIEVPATVHAMLRSDDAAFTLESSRRSKGVIGQRGDCLRPLFAAIGMGPELRLGEGSGIRR